MWLVVLILISAFYILLCCYAFCWSKNTTASHNEEPEVHKQDLKKLVAVCEEQSKTITALYLRLNELKRKNYAQKSLLQDLVQALPSYCKN
ncbi:hypothetical protein BX667DRAFT_501342 [Coemansia mojavensis]|nr:hypothetical protein BX667DRAFT_501342 [Coemansia mojavensis]